MNDESEARLPWPFLVGLLILSGLASWGLVAAEGNALDGARENAWRMALALAPVLTAVLAAFHPRVLAWARAQSAERLATIGVALVVGCFLLMSMHFFNKRVFDLYTPVILAAAVWAAVVCGRQHGPHLGGVALAVWLLLWIPFDLRWYKSIWLGPPSLSYAVCGMLVTLVAILSFGAAGKQESLGLRPPEWADLKHTAVWILPIAILIPIGVGIGFLKVSGEPSMGPGQAGLVFLVLVLTVALPEELFFRGILDSRLAAKWADKPWLTLLLSSFLFGLMHWNNRSTAGGSATYVAMATVAGVFYGLAFRKSRGLVAPVMVHALVDLLWQVFLRGK